MNYLTTNTIHETNQEGQKMDIFEKTEQIYNQKTKTYFQEVLSSYNNGNYRSCLVMLYSVVIYDIVAKLKELSEIYNQSWAQKIIKSINDKRTANPRLADWENELIESVEKQPEFLSQSIIEELKHLKIIRNQCAHPAIDSNDELFLPSRYDAISKITRMLDEILTLPAMFTGKITNYITEQIAKASDFSDFSWKNSQDFSKLFNKHFSHMNDKVTVKVFKDLWKLTFLTQNADCDKNRFANVVFIDLMLSNKKTLLLNAMRDDDAYFNNISPEIVRFLCILVYRNEYLQSMLDDKVLTYMKFAAKEDIDTQIHAWFAFDSIEDYFQNLSSNKQVWNHPSILMNNYRACVILKQNPDYKMRYRGILINIFLSSTSFDDADAKFSSLIMSIKNDYTKEEIIELLTKSEDNNQIYGRYSYMHESNKEKLLEMIRDKEITIEDVKDCSHLLKHIMNES